MRTTQKLTYMTYNTHTDNVNLCHCTCYEQIIWWLWWWWWYLAGLVLAEGIRYERLIFLSPVIGMRGNFDGARMSWGVLQICDLKNDGTNCSIAIKLESVHGLQAHW